MPECASGHNVQSWWIIPPLIVLINWCVRPNLTTSGSGRVWAWIAPFVVDAGFFAFLIISWVLRTTFLSFPMLWAAVVVGGARIVIFWKGQAIRILLRIIRNYLNVQLIISLGGKIDKHPFPYFLLIFKCSSNGNCVIKNKKNFELV